MQKFSIPQSYHFFINLPKNPKKSTHHKPKVTKGTVLSVAVLFLVQLFVSLQTKGTVLLVTTC